MLIIAWSSDVCSSDHDKPVLAVPGMSVGMWRHPATGRNVARLRADGVTVMEPDEGPMACGEFGPGRLPEPAAVLEAIRRRMVGGGALSGKHVIVTAGPTHDPIDPVRYIANRSEERSVGKEWVSTCRSRVSPDH